MLGKYVEVQGRPSHEVMLSRALHVYDTRTSTWHVASRDTSEAGGPDLIYDHQMVMDADRGVMYVFGGRNLTQDAAADSRYSGLYSYNIAANKWTLLRADMTYGYVNSEF